MPYANKEHKRNYNKAYTVFNRDRILAQKKVRQQTIEFQFMRKNYLLQRDYGIDLDTYRKMLADQNGLCAICGKEERQEICGKVASLSVDHNHETDKVRELLCMRCNAILGYAKDDIQLLEAAINYLRKHS